MVSQVAGILAQPKSHEWTTPQRFFDALDAEFGFTLDAAASAENAKCATYYCGEWGRDGLTQPWDGVVWCNPPYGREIGRWVEKGYREAQRGATVVMLIPARTETAYWHDYVMRADEIRLVRGRLRFGGGGKRSAKSHNAPFPSAVVVFRPGAGQLRVTALEEAA
jgi:phage N-6-adenine-methyltransferase